MPHVLRARHLVLLAAATAAIAGCIRNPVSEARQAQQMNDISDALNDLRTDNAALAAALDSIRIVLAKQDTTNARMANVTGVVVAK